MVFALTRGAAVLLVQHPDVYATDTHPVIDGGFEIGNFEVWADRWWDRGELPYADYDLEYPPGSFGTALLPDLLPAPDGYEGRFLAFMVLVDLLGLAGVWWLAHRHGRWWGVVAWLVVVPLLGPVAHSRFDLVVAASLVWAVVAADRQRWGLSGAALGLGAAVKLVPALLLPAFTVVARRRRAVLGGFALVVVASLLPFLDALGPLYDGVVRYHTERPLHAESLGSSLLMAAEWIGLTEVELAFDFGAFNAYGNWAPTVAALANLAAVGILVDSVLQAWLRVRRGDVAHLVLLAVATLTLLTAVGRVLSPQFLVSLVGLYAAALTLAPRAVLPAAALFGGAAALTHLEFPVFFFDVMGRQPEAEALLLARNLLLLAAGLLAARASWRYGGGGSVAPVGERGEQVEALLGHGGERPERDVGDEDDHRESQAQHR